jgi:nucleotide-binding universal stress UspA family protein
MYRYKNIVVGVGLDDRDRTLAEYAELVAFMSHAEHVRFVHVRPAPFALGEFFPELVGSFDEVSAEMRERLSALVESGFHGPTGTAVDCEIVEGAPLAEMLRIARDDGADILVVGRDAEGGTLAEKLARKAPCSVLIVPEEVPAAIERVLVPVDFSDHAADAIDVAVAFAEAARLDEVHVLHVYCVPTTYLKLGKTHAEAERAVRSRVERRMGEFLDGLDLRGLEPAVHYAEGDDAHQTIHDEAAEIGADLVVMGTRGRSDTAAILLGSVAEKTVRTSDVPVVAVKRKGATLGLIDALLSL